MDALKKEKEEWKFLSKAKEEEISQACGTCAFILCVSFLIWQEVKEKFGQLKQIQLEIGILVVFAEFF
jgi:ABC-type transport system involved in cytochrome bd biosynthesis fused ATPase/permease subunit